MAWHMAAGRVQVVILEKLWNFAEELQLKSEELKNEVIWQKKYNRTA
jgi:hypothetical protein